MSVCWLISECRMTVPGSATSTMNAIPASFHPSVSRKVCRFCWESQSTILPRKENIQTSAMAIDDISTAAVMMKGQLPRV